MNTMLFNPYTGRPRDPRDIKGDPAGILMLDPDQFLRAAALSTLPAEPEGWRLVPVVPTEEMFIEGMEADCLGRPSVDDETHVRTIWHAMLSAAPAARPTEPDAGTGEAG